MILLLTDVQNIFYSVRDNYGPSARVDFKKLIEAARNNRQEEVRPIAYVAQLHHEEKDRGLFRALKAVGYEVRTQQVSKRRGRLVHTDMDTAIVLDAMDLVTQIEGPEFNTVVVASGDSDFIPLYKALQKRNVRVEVLGFQDSLSTSLQFVSDEIRLLGKSILFDGEGDGGSDSGSAPQSGDHV